MADYEGVIPLYEPEGYQLRQDPETGKGFYARAEVPSGGASFVSMANHSARARPESQESGMGGSKRPAPAEVAHRALNPEELMALAQQMQDEIAAQSDAIDRQPTSVETTRQRDEGAPYWLRSYMGER